MGIKESKYLKIKQEYQDLLGFDQEKMDRMIEMYVKGVLQKKHFIRKENYHVAMEYFSKLAEIGKDFLKK